MSIVEVPVKCFTQSLKWTEVIYLLTGYAARNPENIGVMENTMIGHRQDRYALFMADTERKLRDVHFWKTLGVFPIKQDWQLREDLCELRELSITSKYYVQKGAEFKPMSVDNYKQTRGW